MEILSQCSQVRLWLSVGQVDCINIARNWALPLEDADYWPLHPGGFRETVLLLMLHGY